MGFECSVQLEAINKETLEIWWADIAKQVGWTTPRVEADDSGNLICLVDDAIIAPDAGLYADKQFCIELHYLINSNEDLYKAVATTSNVIRAVQDLHGLLGKDDEYDVIESEGVTWETFDLIDKTEKELCRSYTFAEHQADVKNPKHDKAYSFWQKASHKNCVARHQDWLATAPTQLTWLAEQVGASDPLGWQDLGAVCEWYTANIHRSPDSPVTWDPDHAPLSAVGCVLNGPYTINTLWSLDAVAHYLAVAIQEHAPHVEWYIPKKPTAEEQDRTPRLHHDSIISPRHPMYIASAFTRHHPHAYAPNTGASLHAAVLNYIAGNPLHDKPITPQ